MNNSRFACVWSWGSREGDSALADRRGHKGFSLVIFKGHVDVILHQGSFLSFSLKVTESADFRDSEGVFLARFYQRITNGSTRFAS